MRKTFLIIFMAFIFVFLTACSNEIHPTKNVEVNFKLIHSEYFDTKVIEDLGGGNLIVIDENTNVLYLFVKGYRASSMTPIYNADGTPMLWKGGAE